MVGQSRPNYSQDNTGRLVTWDVFTEGLKVSPYCGRRHTLKDTGLGLFKSCLTYKLPSRSLSSIVPDSTMQVAGEGAINTPSQHMSTTIRPYGYIVRLAIVAQGCHRSRIFLHKDLNN